MITRPNTYDVGFTHGNSVTNVEIAIETIQNLVDDGIALLTIGSNGNNHLQFIGSDYAFQCQVISNEMSKRRHQ